MEMREAACLLLARGVLLFIFIFSVEMKMNEKFGGKVNKARLLVLFGTCLDAGATFYGFPPAFKWLIL